MKKQTLAISGAWNLVSFVINAIISFITIPFIINQLGPKDYGVFIIITVIGGFMGLQDMGISESSLYYFSKCLKEKSKQKFNTVLASTLALYLIITSIIVLIITAFSNELIIYFNPSEINVNEKSKLLILYSFGIMFFTLSTVFQKVLESNLRYDLINTTNIISNILKSFLVILLLKLGFGLNGLIVVNVANYFFILLTYVFLAKKIMKSLNLSFIKFKETIKQIFNFSIFSFGIQLIGNLSNYIDRLLLGRFINPQSISYLTTPRDMLGQISMATGSLGQALFPRFSSNISEDERRQLYFDSTWVLLFFSLILFIPLSITIPYFLNLWINPTFGSYSAENAKLISINFAFLGLSVTYFNYLKGTGRVKFLSKIMMVLSGISIFIAYILIKKFGLLGAGYRYLLTSWMSIIISIIVIKNFIKPLNLNLELFKNIFFPILCSIAFRLFLNNFNFNTSSWTILLITHFFLSLSLAILIISVDIIIYKNDATSLKTYKYIKNNFFNKYR